jgi:hypothetical protein
MSIQNTVMVQNVDVASGKFNGTCTGEYYTQKLLESQAASAYKIKHLKKS